MVAVNGIYADKQEMQRALIPGTQLNSEQRSFANIAKASSGQVFTTQDACEKIFDIKFKHDKSNCEVRIEGNNLAIYELPHKDTELMKIFEVQLEEAGRQVGPYKDFNVAKITANEMSSNAKDIALTKIFEVQLEEAGRHVEN